MISPAFSSFAAMAVARVLNALPESLLIVLSAGLVLRLIGRRGASTRFAVWLIAFLAVAALPFAEGVTIGRPGFAALHPELTLPARWGLTLFCLWMAATVIALARVIAGIARVRSIRRSCRNIAVDELDPLLQDVLARHSAGRPVRLAVCDQVRVPTAIGFRSPAVVFPAWVLRELTPEQLRPVLIHELAHLARRDDWTNLLQKTLRALFCFHPAVWWIDAKLATEREMACDDAVLAATADPHAYAGSLIGLLEKSGLRRGWSMAQAAVSRAREASVRIARILSPGASRTAVTRLSRPAVALAVLFSAGSCALLTATPQLIDFGPGGEAIAAHAQAMPPLTVNSADTGRFAVPAAVVPAAFHPRQPMRKPLIFNKTAKRRSAAIPSRHELVLRRRSAERATAPAVQLASFAFSGDEGAAPLVVVYSAPASSQAWAGQPSAAQNSVPGDGAVLPASGTPLVLEHLEVITDADGTRMQITRFLLIVPQNAPEPGSIRQSI